jgi:hypothetical protein
LQWRFRQNVRKRVRGNKNERIIATSAMVGNGELLGEHKFPRKFFSGQFMTLARSFHSFILEE